MIRLYAMVEGDDSREFRPLDIAAVCEALHIDGITVDIDDPKVSADFQPGRQVVYWHDDECHE